MSLVSFIQRCGRACGLHGSLFHPITPEERLVVVRELIQYWGSMAASCSQFRNLAAEAQKNLDGYRAEEARLLKEITK